MLSITKYLITGMACMFIGLVTGWKVNEWRKGSAYMAEKVEAVQAGAGAFTANVERVNDAGSQHVKDALQMKSQIAALKKELNDVQKTKPVAADCKPDNDRLRIITVAVDAANRAASGQ